MTYEQSWGDESDIPCPHGMSPASPRAEFHSQQVGYFIFLKLGCFFCHWASFETCRNPCVEESLGLEEE